MSRAEQNSPTEPRNSDSQSELRARCICLFGGTFDPIHSAHLQIAEAAVEKFSLDKVLFVPARNPPHKELHGVTPYEHRLRMVEIACAAHPSFVASRLEEGKGPSYTVDTLERFRNQLGPNDRLLFLIGSDAFDEIESWKRWKEVLKLTEFIVVTRPRHEYRNPEHARAYRLDLLFPVSSSDIRSRLAAGEPTPELPSGVREYIKANRLYRFGEETATVSQ